MSSQGFFEGDSEYRDRIRREANEKTIENATGKKPSQVFWEGNEDYRNRIEREANEKTIENFSKRKPSQGFWEGNEDYHNRLEREANEKTIENYSREKPSQGFFESNEDYSVRIRKEANETIISNSGSKPKQGLFESNHTYRSRIAHEARVTKSTSNPKKSSRITYSSSDAKKKPFVGILIITILILGISVYLLNKQSSNKQPSPPILNDTPISNVTVSTYDLALKNWLLERSNFRPAITQDCNCDNDLPEIRKRYDNDQPYYTSGDFNKDGHVDFAVILIDKSETNRFNTALLIFNGTAKGIKNRPAFFAKNIGTPVGSILFYTKASSRLLVGPWESTGRLVEPEGERYFLN